MKNNKKLIPAIALIIVGTIFVLKNIFGIDIFAWVGGIDFQKIWPLILLVYGVYMLVKYEKK